MVLDAAFLSTQHYKVQIKSNPGNGVAPYLGLVANEKGAFGSPSTTAAKFYLLTCDFFH